MKIISIPKDKSNSLYLAIEANLSSFRKRSISYIIEAQSDDVATVTLNVTGRRGTATRNLVIKFDGMMLYWQVYSGGRLYILDNFGELSSVVRNIISQISVTVTKI